METHTQLPAKGEKKWETHYKQLTEKTDKNSSM